MSSGFFHVAFNFWIIIENFIYLNGSSQISCDFLNLRKISFQMIYSTWYLQKKM